MELGVPDVLVDVPAQLRLLLLFIVTQEHQTTFLTLQLEAIKDLSLEW